MTNSIEIRNTRKLKPIYKHMTVFSDANLFICRECEKYCESVIFGYSEKLKNNYYCLTTGKNSAKWVLFNE